MQAMTKKSCMTCDNNHNYLDHPTLYGQFEMEALTVDGTISIHEEMGSGTPSNFKFSFYTKLQFCSPVLSFGGSHRNNSRIKYPGS